MEYNLRPLKPSDARQTAGLCRLVWPDDSFDSANIEKALMQPGNHAAACWQGDELLGFVDSFITSQSNGFQRWEVDLLAVRPEAQGRGIGRRLVSQSLQTARQKNIPLARGLIRDDNNASQHVFAACGFVKSPELLELWVCQQSLAETGSLPEGAHLIPVSTFQYQGWWLEERQDEPALAAALGHLSLSGILVGALIPQNRAGDCRAAQQLGYHRIGCYHWWMLEL